MPNLALFEIEPSKLDGVWVHMGGGGYIKIRRWLNAEHVARIAELRGNPAYKQLDELQRALCAAAGTVLVAMEKPPEGARDINGDLIEGATEWTDPDTGGPLVFTRELGEKLLTDPRWPLFPEVLLRLSNELATFRSERAKASAGNSSSASNGASTTRKTSRRGKSSNAPASTTRSADSPISTPSI